MLYKMFLSAKFFCKMFLFTKIPLKNYLLYSIYYTYHLLNCVAVNIDQNDVSKIVQHAARRNDRSAIAISETISSASYTHSFHPAASYIHFYCPAASYSHSFHPATRWETVRHFFYYIENLFYTEHNKY